MCYIFDFSLPKPAWTPNQDVSHFHQEIWSLDRRLNTPHCIYRWEVTVLLESHHTSKVTVTIWQSNPGWRWCSCVAPSLPFSAADVLRTLRFHWKVNYKLLLSPTWTHQIPSSLRVKWILIFTKRAMSRCRWCKSGRAGYLGTIVWPVPPRSCCSPADTLKMMNPSATEPNLFSDTAGGWIY